MENLTHIGSDKNTLNSTTAHTKIILLPDDALLSNLRDTALANQTLKYRDPDQPLGDMVWEQIRKFDGMILDRAGNKVVIDEQTVRILFSSPDAYWLETRLYDKATGGEMFPPVREELPLLRLLTLSVQLKALRRKRGLID